MPLQGLVICVPSATVCLECAWILSAGRQLHF
jgi:hypothetical protein